MGGISATGFVDDLQWNPLAVEGDVDSSEEAVIQWLNTAGIDLAELGSGDLRKMIADILAKHPEFKNDTVIRELIDLAGDWEQAEVLFKTDFGREAIGEHFLLRFAKLTMSLNPSVQGPLAIIVANAEGINAALNVAKMLEFGSYTWSTMGNIESVKQARQFLSDIELLGENYDLGALGVAPMAAAVKEALAKYDKSVESAAGLEGEKKSKAERSALSTLRIDIAQARIGFLESQAGAAGVTGGNTELVKDIKYEQSVINQEKLWQRNLNSTWEYSMLGGQHFGWDPDGMKEQRAYLATQYQQLLASGDTVGAAYVLSRIQSLDTAIGETNRLIDGGSNPASASVMMVGLGLALNLVDSDLALAGALRDQAIAAGDKKLEMEYQTKIDMLNDIRGRIMDFMKALGQGFMSAAVAA